MGVRHGESFHGVADGFIGSEDFRKDDVDDGEDFDEDGKAFADDFGFIGCIGIGDEGEAVFDCGDGWIDFAAFSFADNAGEHLDDVVIGSIDIFSVAGSAVALDDAPFGEVAQVHAGIASGDVELGDHLVHGEVFAGDEEESMELRHCAVDAPT